MRNKSALITSGCGIAGVFLLDRNRVPKEFAGKIRKRAKRNGSPQVQFLVRDILMFMDHRSNGEGAGIAIYRKTSSLYKSSGFPLVYTPSEDNLFILNVLASTRSEVDPLKELASNMGIEVIRIQDKEKNSRARKDVLLDMNMYEIAVIVRNDRESNF
ncbi:MAG: hypothetical protein FJ088_03970, partial [Deltaproteobacteria bacterium]|nr:hypothetical protein [Deltaproteobacteria bacterium]